MSFFDKLVIALLNPLGSALCAGALALLLAARGHRRLAWWIGGLGWAWLLLCALPVPSNLLVAAEQGAYPHQAPALLPQADALVVLGGGIDPPQRAGDLPHLHLGADRVWYAARLWRAGRAPLLVLSGGSDPRISVGSEAQAMRALLLDLGVPDRALRLEQRSRTTRQNAQYTAALLRPLHIRRILLVTSAWHMRRAVALFQAQGFDVVPAPCDSLERQWSPELRWWPQATALQASGLAISETVGWLSGH
jgi:uncharacterized SAM-binding protein YcdF (DUF218 family)